MNEKPNSPSQEVVDDLDMIDELDLDHSGLGILGLQLQFQARYWCRRESPEFDAVADAAMLLEEAILALNNTLDAEQRKQLADIEDKITLLIEAIASPFAQEKENRRQGQQNSKKAAAQNRAWDLAYDCWKVDPTIRMGTMCSQLWSQLIDEGYRDVLPDTGKGIKAWIQDIAPPSARQPGRPKKEK